MWWPRRSWSNESRIQGLLATLAGKRKAATSPMKDSGTFLTSQRRYDNSSHWYVFPDTARKQHVIYMSRTHSLFNSMTKNKYSNLMTLHCHMTSSSLFIQFPSHVRNCSKFSSAKANCGKNTFQCILWPKIFSIVLFRDMWKQLTMCQNLSFYDLCLKKKISRKTHMIRPESHRLPHMAREKSAEDLWNLGA